MNAVADHLDALSNDEARAALARCCASQAWVTRMLQRRPFGTDERLFLLADQEWNALPAHDWLEAFAGHPRIGERAGVQHAATASWSSKEQAGMDAASAETARDLAEGNRRYEEKFGHVFLICATGKSAAEMLAALRERMNHPPDQEARIAAAEQAKITCLRLRKLVQS